MLTTYSAEVGFYYKKAGCGYQKLGLTHQPGKTCFIPDDHPDSPTINQVFNGGIDGLINKVKGIILYLPSETFSTHFSVGYIPDGQEEYSTMITVGDVDISGKDSAKVIKVVRDLVNRKLLPFMEEEIEQLPSDY